MRTRLSSRKTTAKDLSFVKEGGELFFNGDEFENARWVTVVGVPDEDNVAEDTEIECVDEKGRKFSCFADQLSPKDSSGVGVDDPAYFKVARNLRRAAKGYVDQKFASVKKIAKDDEEDGTWCSDCMDEVEGEVKDFGEWIEDLAKEENLSDEAVEVLENYSFNVGDKQMCHDCAHAKMESIFDESPELKNRGRKTASVKVAAEGDAEVAPKPTGELTSEDMWSWLQKQAQYKSVIETISNEIANNAVEDVMFGRVLNQNPAGGTVQNAYDWAVRLLKNQFSSQIGKRRVQKNVEPVEAPEIPEMPEVDESVEVEAKTASRRRLTAK